MVTVAAIDAGFIDRAVDENGIDAGFDFDECRAFIAASARRG